MEPSGVLKVCHVVSFPSTPSQIIWHPIEKNRFAVGGDDVSIDVWDVRGDVYRLNYYTKFVIISFILVVI